MSIFTPQTPTAPTKDQVIAEAQNEMAVAASALSKQIEGVIVHIASLINASTVYSAQDYFTALGTNGGELIQALQSAIGLAQILDSSYQIPTFPYTWTVNADGSVTLTPNA